MQTTVHRLAGVALLLAGLGFPIAAQEKDKDKAKLPPPDRVPHLVLAHSGPPAPVTALAFAPDSSSLYVGGFDKLVRRYNLVDGKYVAAGVIRVPIGPGNAGVVNALAVSPDGKWVAAAGRAPMRGETWTGADDGITADRTRLLPEVWRDSGVVYLFDPAKPDGGKVLRGQRAGVRALAFADPAPADGPVLVTAGIEWDNDKKAFSGVARAFNVTTGEELAPPRTGLPTTPAPAPVVAAWATGANRTGLRVAVNWPTGTEEVGQLLVWHDPGKAGEKVTAPLAAALTAPLAVRAGAEVITGGYRPDQRRGELTVRGPDGTALRTTPLTGKAGQIVLPVAVAPLGAKGAATAVLSRVISGAGAPQHELRLIAPGAVPPIELAGIDASRRPVLSLAASPDGKFVAVAGFADNRVEVYDVAAIPAGNPAPQKLAGSAPGFSKVAFLAGEKLWVGGPTDTLAKGGVVLDLDNKVRVAAPPGAKDAPKLDAPDAGPAPTLVEPDAIKKLPARVVVTVGGAEKVVPLPAGARATAAALLPAKPAWDADLGPVLAVAQLEDDSQTVQIALYDPLTAKPLFRFGGPTLPLRALAFSSSRALLAGAGDDGTVAVWSLKNLTRKIPAIEGVFVTDRAGEVVIASVRADSPAAGKLNAEDVIESISDPKGAQKAVKTALDFVSAVKALKIGDNAQIKVKGKAAVAVPVGARIGFRHPLFTLWVDPLAKDGKHDWVGWTTSGPYDTSGEAGEARIGWVAATGDPARPVAFAGANQYRKAFYKFDIIRLLLKTADYNEAVAALPRPRPAVLTASFNVPTVERDGQKIVREKGDRLVVQLDDPDGTLDADRTELRWQISGPAGTSEWKQEAVAAGRREFDLNKHEWARGEHRARVKVYRTADPLFEEMLLHESTVVVSFVPPAPVLAVKIDGQVPAAGAVIETENDVVEVTATVDTKDNPAGAVVTVSATNGDKPAELAPAAGGFAPRKVKIKPDGTTTIMVTATNRGAGATAALESHSVEVQVRRAAKVPPPAVKLRVLADFDARATADAPYVVSSPKAAINVTVTGPNPVESFQWKIGDADWQDGKLDAKTNTATREVDLPVLGIPIVVQARAKSKDSAFATEAITLRYDGLPEVSVDRKGMPFRVTGPELNLAGDLKVIGKRQFAIRLLVTSVRTGQTRMFDPTPNAALTRWDAGVTLFPGENQLGYVIKYDDDRKEFRAGLARVEYVRPPLVVGGAPVEVGTGAVGTVALAVVSAPDAAPMGLSVNGSVVGARTHARPFRLFGAGLWVVTARGVAVKPGANRLTPIPAVVRNLEAPSRELALEVRGEPERVTPAPTIRLTHKGKAIAPDQGLPPIGYSNFDLDLKVSSETRLTRVEILRGAGPAADLEAVPGVKAADAGAVAGGFELNAKQTIGLRPGAANYVRVVASNDGGTAEVAFYVSYAPPPVRIVIKSVTEPNLKPIEVKPGNANPIPVGGAVIDVEGSVQWDFDNEPIARDRNLTVVFNANGVTHLPIAVGPATDAKERKFKGRVYLNTLDPNPTLTGVTRVRAELRSGEGPVPIPQEGLQQATIQVASQNPLRKQRLHVLVVGLEVPNAERAPLVRRVVEAVGGTIARDTPNFIEGKFERPGFEFAYLYSPRLGYTNARDLNALLDAARTDIQRRARRAGEEWVNDVIVVYYQGADWVDKDTGRWHLHSATSRSGAAGDNPVAAAIRLDSLPLMPGMPVAVVNVDSTDTPTGSLALDLPYMRYAWTQATTGALLLDQLKQGVSEKRQTFGGMANFVNKGIPKDATLGSSLPAEGIGGRVVGLP